MTATASAMEAPRTPAGEAASDLPPPPDAILDERTGLPICGRFRGPVPRWNPEAARLGALARRLREKRWHYVGLVSPRLSASLGIFSSGYISVLLMTLHDREDGLSGEGTVKGAGQLAVFFAGGLAGGTAAFGQGRSFCVQRVRDGGGELHAVAHGVVAARPVELDLRFDLRPARFPALALTAAVGGSGGGYLHTHKVAGLPVEGEVRWGDRRYAIEPATSFGHVDATIGCPPRRTFWNWCSAGGFAADGRRVGVNVSASLFAEGPDENALWLDGEPHLLGACHFEYDPARPAEPWTVVSADGRLRLTLSPRDVRRERTDLGLVRSSFIQPVGPIAGHFQAPAGARLDLRDLFGVMEEHDAVW